MSVTVTVIVSSVGETSYEVAGIKGLKCTEITKHLRNLGNVMTSRLTSEAFESPEEICQEETLDE